MPANPSTLKKAKHLWETSMKLGSQGYYVNKEKLVNDWLEFANGDYTRETAEKYIHTWLRPEGELLHYATVKRRLDIMREATPSIEDDGTWIKQGLKGYSYLLNENEIKKEYKQPVFPDHAIRILKEMKVWAKEPKKNTDKQWRLGKCLSTSIMFYTGMRSIDVSEIRFRDITILHEFIKLSPAVRKGNTASRSVIHGYMRIPRSQKLADINPYVILEEIKQLGEINEDLYITNMSDKIEISSARNTVMANMAKRLRIPAFTGHCFRAGMAVLLTALGVHYREIKNYIGWRTDEMVENYRRGIEEAHLRQRLNQILEIKPEETIGERLDKIFEIYDTREGVALFSHYRIILGIQKPANIRVVDHTEKALHQKDFLKPEHNEEKEKVMRASSTTRIARMRKTSIKREKNKIDIRTTNGLRKLREICKKQEKKPFGNKLRCRGGSPGDVV